MNESIVLKMDQLSRRGVPRMQGFTEDSLCTEQIVSWVTEGGMSDRPRCVDGVVREFTIVLNDSEAWLNKKTRAKGMRRLAVAQIGSNKLSSDVTAELILKKIIYEGTGLQVEDMKRSSNLLEAMYLEYICNNLETRRNDLRAYYRAACCMVTYTEPIWAIKQLGATFADKTVAQLNRAAELAVEVLTELGSPGVEYLKYLPEW